MIIAIDHGLFDGPIPAMEDLPATAAKINPAVDAVLLAPGMLPALPCRFSPAPSGRWPMVRLNWNTVYCFKLGYTRPRASTATIRTDALREGMDIALVSLTLQTGDEERDAANVEVFSRLTNACHALGIPVIGEYFPTDHAELSAEQLHDDVLLGSRVVAELGADAIKTFHTCRFPRVTAPARCRCSAWARRSCPRRRPPCSWPAGEVAEGAGGVVFGRNAIQVPDPRLPGGVVRRGQAQRPGR